MDCFERVQAAVGDLDTLHNIVKEELAAKREALLQKHLPQLKEALHASLWRQLERWRNEHLEQAQRSQARSGEADSELLELDGCSFPTSVRVSVKHKAPEVSVTSYPSPLADKEADSPTEHTQHDHVLPEMPKHDISPSQDALKIRSLTFKEGRSTLPFLQRTAPPDRSTGYQFDFVPAHVSGLALLSDTYRRRLLEDLGLCTAEHPDVVPRAVLSYAQQRQRAEPHSTPITPRTRRTGPERSTLLQPSVRRQVPAAWDANRDKDATLAFIRELTSTDSPPSSARGLLESSYARWRSEQAGNAWEREAHSELNTMREALRTTRKRAAKPKPHFSSVLQDAAFVRDLAVQRVLDNWDKGLHKLPYLKAARPLATSRTPK